MFLFSEWPHVSSECITLALIIDMKNLARGQDHGDDHLRIGRFKFSTVIGDEF